MLAWGRDVTGACLRVRLANKAVVGELLKQRFLWLTGATTYVIIGGVSPTRNRHTLNVRRLVEYYFLKLSLQVRPLTGTRLCI